MIPSAFEGARIVMCKELRVSFRQQAGWCAMLMFALTTLACVSLSLSGGILEPKLQAALLWVILFFSSIAGADRGFADEDMAGTLPTLRLYGASQSVLWGKVGYTFCLLLILAAFLVPLYLIFLDVMILRPLWLLAAIIVGMAGLSIAGTLLGALATGASVRGGIFTVLMLPVILPVFLPGIALTDMAFGGEGGSGSYLLGMILYDLMLGVAASLLFDYLWYDD